MKIKVTRLDFRKDKDFDPDGNIEDYYAKPCTVQYKKHWWNKWTYIMDSYVPMLFYGPDSEVVRDAIRILND